MAERKPPGVSWESWVDRQIREGREQGAFDRLPGHGKPIPDIDRPRDELWWVRQKLRREKVSMTPVAIQLRRDVEQTYEQLVEIPSEAELREHLESLNTRIRDANRMVISGPPSTLLPLDVERIVERWKTSRQSS